MVGYVNSLEGTLYNPPIFMPKKTPHIFKAQFFFGDSSVIIGVVSFPMDDQVSRAPQKDSR